MPVIEPPVIDTPLDAWVAILPRPREVLAVAPLSATQVVPFPTMKLLSVTARAAMAESSAS
jgi:hypothetical protein